MKYQSRHYKELFTTIPKKNQKTSVNEDVEIKGIFFSYWREYRLMLLYTKRIAVSNIYYIYIKIYKIYMIYIKIELSHDSISLLCYISKGN